MQKLSIIIVLFLFLSGINHNLAFSQQCDTLYIRRNIEGKIVFAKFAIDPNSNRKLSQDTIFLRSILQAGNAELTPIKYDNNSTSIEIEASALNEGFSDIWGACVKYWTAPEKQIWKIGDEIILTPSKNCIRNLQNPKSNLSVICGYDTYDEHWKPDSVIDKYSRSLILSHWFYLLCEGGCGTNDNGDAFHVTGISIEKAQHIAYRTLAYYLFPTADFRAARDASIQAAIDLFGANSAEVISTRSAWHAVGLGVDTIINSNTFWNNSVQLGNACVIIQSGRTLTISDTVFCNQSSSIILLPGAKLILDGGTLTNACPRKLWQGITVLGIGQNQGIVQIINGGKIENAYCAITANASSAVYADDAFFINNTIGVFFKQNADGGTFKRTKFDLNNSYLGARKDFDAHLKIYSSGEVSVEGCTFLSTAPSSTTKNRGIDAFNSNLIVKEHCPRNCGVPCSGCYCSSICMLRNSFSGFSKAVYAINSGTTPTLKIRHSDFTNNLYSIYIDGINNHQILRNNFVLKAANAEGVTIGNATGYKIEENDFTNTFTGPGDQTIGLNIGNSGSAENEVQSQHVIDYYYNQNANNEFPPIVSRNVNRIPTTASNGCPSKIGNPRGGGTRGGDEWNEEWNLEQALAQYDEWNAQYEYWLALANEVCGEAPYGLTLLRSYGLEDDECATLWDLVSHYSALKDNYFNAIIVEAMTEAEEQKGRKAEEQQGEINGRISPSNLFPSNFWRGGSRRLTGWLSILRSSQQASIL